MGQLHIRLLGRLSATLDTGIAIEFDYDKVWALLAYLAVEDGQAQHRDTLCGLLWPEFDQNHARQNLSQALYSLRRSLTRARTQAEFVQANRVTVRLGPAAAWQSDVNTFRKLARVGFAAHDSQQKAALLEEAVGEYGGSFLEGFTLSAGNAWDEWVLVQRERLHRLAVNALGALAQIATDQSAPEQALHWAYRLVDLDPWQEEGHRQVMRLLARLGRRAEALAQFETCRRLLRDELDVEPAEESWALYRALAADAAPRMTAQMTAETDRDAQRRLPVPRSGFVGREVELAQIQHRLADPACRLLTIVGLGGMGKTQLALHAAHAQQTDLAAGAVFVPLVAVTTAEGIVSAICASLGLPAAASAAHLAQMLRPLQLLLVADNCEHLSSSTHLFAHLLEQAPSLKILATSRGRLNLQEEWLLPLDGLAVPPAPEPNAPQPDPTVLSEFSATHLFVNCLRRVRPGLVLDSQHAAHIAHICRLLAGIPLALELSAAWHRVLPLERIAAQAQHILDLPPTATSDTPDRQRSMRAVFDHSWALLSPHAADLLRQLSVFRGGFTLEAAQSVAGAGLSDLAELVDRSWLRVNEAGRYNLHELVRQYCAERLLDADAPQGLAAAAQNRHAAYFAAFLKEQEARYNRESAVLAEISVEIGNIETAWDWVTRIGDGETARPLCTGLFFIGDMWGWLGLVQPLFVRGVVLLQTHLQAEEKSPAELDAVAVLIANILHAQGVLLVGRAHYSTALASVTQGEAYARQAEPSPPQQFILIYTRFLRAGILRAYHKFDEAERILCEEVIPYWEKATTSEFQGPDFTLGNAYMSLAANYVCQKRFTDTRTLLARSLAIKRRDGEFRFRAMLYKILARACAGEGKYAEGLDAALEAERLSRAFGDRINLASTLVTTAHLLLANGQTAAARQRCLEAMDLAKETGDTSTLVWARIHLARVALGEKNLAEASQLTAEALALYQQEEMESIDLWDEILLTQNQCALVTEQPDADCDDFRKVPDLPH